MRHLAVVGLLCVTTLPAQASAVGRLPDRSVANTIVAAQILQDCDARHRRGRPGNLDRCIGQATRSRPGEVKTVVATLRTLERVFTGPATLGCYLGRWETFLGVYADGLDRVRAGGLSRRALETCAWTASSETSRDYGRVAACIRGSG
jgi:hypothetical protein